MKQNYLVALLLFVGYFSQAQSLPQRYQEAVFSNFTTTSNIKFSTGVPQPKRGGGFYETITGLPVNVREYDTEPKDLFMNIFQPVGDTLTQRPVVIICFGGGFVAGQKDHWSTQLIAQELAKRGFVTACIDYRLGMNIFNEDLAYRAVYRALQDGRSAVRFFRADAAGANNYKIDPNQIFIGGHSAGAFIALQAAYLDKESERPASTYTWTQSSNNVADLGCLDCAGDNQGFDGKPNAVMGLAGAVGFLEHIEGSTDLPNVMFHSSDDGTVPYGTGEPFSSFSWIPGINLPTVQGSSKIDERANTVNAPKLFYSYTNRGHAVHEQNEDTETLHPEIVPNTANYFYSQKLKPNTVTFEGLASVCENETSQTYTLENDNAFYYDWQVEGGTLVDKNAYSNSITVSWDATAGSNILRVTPYSRWLARGEEANISIAIQDAPQVENPIDDYIWDKSASNPHTIDISNVFDEVSTYEVSLEKEGIIEASISETTLSITTLVAGELMVTLTGTNASDCSQSTTFKVQVCETPARPTLSYDGTVLTSSYAGQNEWYKDNVLIEGANGKTYEPTESGNYTVKAINSTENCDDSEVSEALAVIIEVAPTSLEQVEKYFHIYPNPTSNQVFIKSKNTLFEAQKLVLYNMYGKQVWSVDFKEEVSLGHLPKGLYYLVLEGKQNRLIYKLAKQ